MPSIKIYTTQKGIDSIKSLVNLLNTETESLERIQEGLEDEIMWSMAQSMTNNNNRVLASHIEVHWIVTQRSRNAPSFGFELIFSEYNEEKDPGYVMTPALRRHVKDSVAKTLCETVFLPGSVSIGVWVLGQKSATYTDFVHS